MNDFSKLLNGLQKNNLNAQQTEQQTSPFNNTQNTTHNNNIIIPDTIMVDNGDAFAGSNISKVSNPLFDTSSFRNLVKRKSHTKNKTYAASSIGRISGYSIGHDCIRTTLYKMLDYKLSDYSNNWLPLGFRASLGTSVHDYLQDLSLGELFTECELTLKVPSKLLSMRLDAVINDETIVEIKSCSYADYSKLMKTRSPRTGDFYQVVFYRWLLQNHLEEIKKQKPSHGGKLPALASYKNIKYIQMIYVCHELIAGDDNESMAEAVKFGTNLRRYAKDNTGNPKDFWFILPLTIDTTQIDISKYENFLVDKMENIIENYNNKTIPDFSNQYVDKTKCFFCGFKSICKP